MKGRYILRGNVVSWPKEPGPITQYFGKFIDWLSSSSITKQTKLMKQVDSLGHVEYEPVTDYGRLERIIEMTERDNVVVIRHGNGLSDRSLTIGR